jgi:hypothetical protein
MVARRKPSPMLTKACPARVLIMSVVDVFNGRRPLAQLEERLDRLVFVALRSNVGTGTRASRAEATVCSVHVTYPAEGVIEACALVAQGARGRALVARLERRSQGYVGTFLRFV